MTDLIGFTVHLWVPSGGKVNISTHQVAGVCPHWPIVVVKETNRTCSSCTKCPVDQVLSIQDVIKKIMI